MLLERHMALVKEWNPVCGLVSTGDVDKLWKNHVLDSIGLVPLVRRLGVDEGVVLDIGSGGGYPAIPVKILCPKLSLILLERSDKKAGFLRKVVAALGLRDVEIRQGEYPMVAGEAAADVITARAVERPKKVIEAILEGMQGKTCFLCQSGDPRELAPKVFHVERGEGRFHVERVDDLWKSEGIRRGEVFIVRRYRA